MPDIKKEVALAACPFCGGEAEYFKRGVLSKVKCLRCGIEKMTPEIWNTRNKK